MQKSVLKILLEKYKLSVRLLYLYLDERVSQSTLYALSSGNYRLKSEEIGRIIDQKFQLPLGTFKSQNNSMVEAKAREITSEISERISRVS